MKNDFFKVENFLANRETKKALDFLDEMYLKYKNNCVLSKKADILLSSDNQKDVKKGIKLLEKMLKSEKRNIELITKIAYNYFFISNLKKSLKYYKTALKIEPCAAYLNYNVGNVYHFLKQNKKAAYYYLIAIKLKPNHTEALNNLGILYYDSKEYKTAIELHNDALKTNPNHPEAYHHLGIIEREFKNDLELSMYYLKKAIRLDPDYLLNHYQLALTYKKMGELEKARGELKVCLHINPKHKDSSAELKKIS